MRREWRLRANGKRGGSAGGKNTMTNTGLTICAAALGAALLATGPGAYAFTDDSGGGAGAGGGSEASEPSGYDFSGQNFEFSVRKTEPAQGNAAAPQAGSPPPASPSPPPSHNFFDRAWDGLLDMMGLGD